MPAILELPRTAAQKPPARAAEYIPDRPGGATGILVVTIGKKPTGYRLTEFATDGDFDAGRAFHVRKTFGGSDRESEEYSLYVDLSGGPGWDLCGCKGHYHHGHCKHVDAVRHLIGAGLMPAVAPAALAARPAVAAPPRPEPEYAGDPEADHVPADPVPACWLCQGTRKLDDATCPSCNGTGVEQVRQLRAETPPPTTAPDDADFPADDSDADDLDATPLEVIDAGAALTAPMIIYPSFTCPLCSGVATMAPDAEGVAAFYCPDCPVGGWEPPQRRDG